LQAEGAFLRRHGSVRAQGLSLGRARGVLERRHKLAPV
jgi:hypothetical protein